MSEVNGKDQQGLEQTPKSAGPTRSNSEILQSLLNSARIELGSTKVLQGLVNPPLIQLETGSRLAELIRQANATTALIQEWDKPAQDALARLASSIKMPEITFPDLDKSILAAHELDIMREAASHALRGINPKDNLGLMLAAGLADLVKANFVIQPAIPEYVQKLRESIELQDAEFRSYISSIIDSQRVLENVFESLNPAVEAIRQHFIEQNAMLGRALEPLHQYFQQEEQAAEAFLYAGFCMAPSMNSKLVQRVKTLRTENKKRMIAQAIMRYYQSKNYARLKAMVSNLESNALFAPRMPIIRDALLAHLNRQYTLSIPALLTQIEGVVGDFARHREIPTKLAKKQLFSDTLDNIPSNWMRLAVHKSVTEFVDTTLYASKDFKKLGLRNKERINRHVVLHGRQVNYASERNSLRLFLLLDAFSALKIEPPANPKRRRAKRSSDKGKSQR